jgi:hypothetical protein
VPVSANALLAPAGEVEVSFFPGETQPAVLARLQAYLDDGYDRVAASVTDVDTQDEIATAWAYYRAYKAIHLTMSRSAASKAVAGEASSTTLAMQIQAFADERDDWLAEFTRLMPVDASQTTASPGSVCTNVCVDFPPWPLRP